MYQKLFFKMNLLCYEITCKNYDYCFICIFDVVVHLYSYIHWNLEDLKFLFIFLQVVFDDFHYMYYK